MSYIINNFNEIKDSLPVGKVTLVAVTKNYPVEKIRELYDAGHRDFGENRVQELLSKKDLLPPDIRWHLIGHLQRNKVKYIAPFINLIHSVDSLHLLEEINKEAIKNNRVIDCLIQIYLAAEETKYGMYPAELEGLLQSNDYNSFRNIRLCGLMAMASNVDDEEQVRTEFSALKSLFDKIKIRYFSEAPAFSILSMGMSSDYRIAVEEGSNMVRLGSVIFGERMLRGVELD